MMNEASILTDNMELLYTDELPVFEKYDEFVPPELVRKGFAEGVLDVDGMKERVRQWEQYATSYELPAGGGVPGVDIPWFAS